MVYILLGTGFEETEALVPLDLLRRAGIDTLTVALKGKTVTGGHGISVEADITLGEMDLTQLDMIVLPGGLVGVASIGSCQEALNAVSFAWHNGKFVCAICAAPTLLDRLGILSGRQYTCYPGCEEQISQGIYRACACVQDQNLITSASAGCAVTFGLKLIAALKGEKAAQAIAQQIIIR